jgi:guanylate kinase
MLGVMLYGPPASGKDTVTKALHRLDPSCVLFPRLKVGGGRTTSYRMTDSASVEALRMRGDVIWENHRYGALYLIDRPALVHRLQHHVPVLHLGQPEAIDAVIAATPGTSWAIVALWCPREVAAQRLTARGSDDVAARLCAWDTTPPIARAALTLNTAKHSPDAAARLIKHQRGPDSW